MSSIVRFMLGAGALIVFAGLAPAQEVELGFSGPASIEGPAGSVQEASYQATLTQLSGTSGAQGWSIIMNAENAEFTDITVSGTTADELINREPCYPGYPLPCSFETYQTGCGLACSAVVLDFMSPTTLPASGTSTIVEVTIAAEVPECGGTATLSYVDEAGCFLGVADTNVVTIQAQSVTFDNGKLSQAPLEIEVGAPCDPATLIAALQEDIEGLAAAAGVKTGLTALLDAALEALENENETAAISILEAFTVAVQGMSGTALLVDEAEALVASAEEILALLATPE